MKKSAFTIAESLVGLLIISMAVMAAFNFASSYQQVTFERDASMNSLMKNITVAESLRAEENILPRLYELSLTHEIKVTAVGIGEIQLNEDGTFSVIEEDKYNLPEEIQPENAKLFKIEIGGSTPNTKIITVVRAK